MLCARQWAPILALTLVLGGLYWRWSYLSNQLRDVWIRDYVLSDAVDLAWMEWIKDLEPRIDAMLEKRRPDARYTAAHPRPVVGRERTLFGQQERKYSRGTQGVAQEFAKH